MSLLGLCHKSSEFISLLIQPNYSCIQTTRTLHLNFVNLSSVLLVTLRTLKFRIPCLLLIFPINICRPCFESQLPPSEGAKSTREKLLEVKRVWFTRVAIRRENLVDRRQKKFHIVWWKRLITVTSLSNQTFKDQRNVLFPMQYDIRKRNCEEGNYWPHDCIMATIHFSLLRCVGTTEEKVFQTFFSRYSLAFTCSQRKPFTRIQVKDSL